VAERASVRTPTCFPLSLSPLPSHFTRRRGGSAEYESPNSGRRGRCLPRRPSVDDPQRSEALSTLRAWSADSQAGPGAEDQGRVRRGRGEVVADRRLWSRNCLPIAVNGRGARQIRSQCLAGTSSVTTVRVDEPGRVGRGIGSNLNRVQWPTLAGGSGSPRSPSIDGPKRVRRESEYGPGQRRRQLRPRLQQAQ
jgi:hypothetical protein